MQHTQRIHLISSAVVALAALIMFFVIIPAQIPLPRFSFGLQNSNVTPRLVPQIWSLLLLAVSSAHIVVIVLKPNSLEASAELEAWPKSAKLRGFVGILLTGSYIFVSIPTFGFYVSTLAYLALGFWLFYERSPLRIVITAVLVPAAFYLFFFKLMNLNLPHGLFL